MPFESQDTDILPPPGLEDVMPRSAKVLELNKCLLDAAPGNVAEPTKAIPDLNDRLPALLINPMITNDIILAHANMGLVRQNAELRAQMELIRQNAELRAKIAHMGANTTPAAKPNAKIMKRSKRTSEHISRSHGQGESQNLKPIEIKVAADSLTPTASTVCSSGCASEVDENPQIDTRELNSNAHGVSEDEVNQESCARHRVTCANEENHGTTVVMRNIPFEYTRDHVLELLDRQGFSGLYDLLCLPVDFQTELNHGYVFINFVTLEDAAAFKKRFDGFSDWSMSTDKGCEVAWFDSTQDIDSHIQRYRNSPLMHESVEDRFKPILFKDGVRIPFPEPTKKIRAPRRNRGKGGGSGAN